MWILLAFGSAFFAGLTAILAKCGMRGIDSNVATALRTVVVLLFSWLMAGITGGFSFSGLYSLKGETILFLLLSGLATGASWLCYFRALQIGDINKVTPVDKSSTILTMLLAAVFLGEDLGGWKIPSIFLIALGTWLMIQKKEGEETGEAEKKDHRFFSGGWLFYAAASAIFAALTSILGKMGMQGIDSNLGTALRTGVVLLMAWVVVFVTGRQGEIRHMEKKNWLFVILSGFATGGSWLCYYRALQTGPASVIVPIDKLSILVTIAFSRIVFKEKLTPKAVWGLLLLVGGTLLLLV
jgi:transporter family protein